MLLFENVIIPEIANIKISYTDLLLSDYLNVRDNLNNPAAIIAKSKLNGRQRNTSDELKKLVLFTLYCFAEGNTAAGSAVWKGFLKKCDALSYVKDNVKHDTDGNVDVDIKAVIPALLSDPSIAIRLNELRNQAANTAFGAQAKAEKDAKEAAAKAKDIPVVTSPTGSPYYRITLRDPAYGKSGCARFIVFSKKTGNNTYQMAIEGSSYKRRGPKSEPVFETPEDGVAFIRKAITNLKTSIKLEDMILTVTNRRFNDAIPRDDYHGSPYWEAYSDLSKYHKVDTDCGPCYMNNECEISEEVKGNKSMRTNYTDALVENTDEAPSANAVAKHTELNPKLWTADEVLKPEVEEKIKQIVDVFLAGLAEDEIKINVRDILIIGSNASYNYTPYSDLDLHIIVDTDSLECPDNLYSKLYSAYRSLFNKRLDIDFYDIPVEIYVEDESTPRVSNGVYSVLNREWLQEPKYVNIPDMDMDAFNAELAKWEERYRQVLNDAVGELEEYYEPDPDAAEDIKTQQIKEIDAYIEDLYNLRKIGLPLTGEYGLENVIFKTIRNKGYLDRLKDLKNELLGKELSLEETIENIANSELEDIPEGLDMLTNKQITEYRIKIAQLAHTQPLINAYGKFTISNVRENDADYICRILKAQDFIVSVNKTPGRFDFKAMATTGMPGRMYNITGQIKI